MIGFIGDEKKGRTVLLRADIDALPMKEQTVNGGGKQKVVVSETGTAGHLCGHDCHAAMLLGAARVLKEHEGEIPGRVVLMFERGEECGAGIPYLLKWIIGQGFKVDTSFAMHVFPMMPTRTITVMDGSAGAGFVGFDVKILGKSAHGSEPNIGVSPIDCFVSMYETIQSMRMKYANPYDPMVFSVGQVHAGQVGNIIPGELTFAGSFRLHNFDDGLRIKENLIKTIEKTAEIYGCTAQYNLMGPTLSLFNDPECTVLTKAMVADTFGPDIFVEKKPLMGGESHSMTARLWPGTYIYLGTYNEEKGMTAMGHNEYFEPDEDVFVLGVACFIGYAMEFLKRGPDTSDRIYRGDLKEFFTLYNPRALEAYA